MRFFHLTTPFLIQGAIPHRPKQPHRKRRDTASAAPAPSAAETSARGSVLRSPRFAAVLTGAVTLAVYLATLPPTIVSGDSGEFVSAARVLGVVHPTGYPLYMLLAKLFDLLPFANPAVRVALLSALSAALSAALLAWCAATLFDSASSGIVAGTVFGLQKYTWSLAVIPEVYTLSALLIALALTLFVAWQRAPRPALLYGLALVVGLGLAHHRTAIFFTFPLLLMALSRARPNRRTLAWMLVSLLGPLLLYLYLPIRAAAHPAVLDAEAHHWQGFLKHVLGRQFYYLVFSRPMGERMEVLRQFLSYLVAQVSLGGVALIGIGLVSMLRSHRALALSLFCSSALLLVWNLGYYVDDVGVFFLPCWLAFGLWVGAGVDRVAQALARRAGPRLTWVSAAVAVVLALLFPLSLLQHNWTQCNMRDHWKDYDQGKLLLSQLPPHSIYVAGEDDYVLLYLQQVEGLRRDVDLVRPGGTYVSGHRDLVDLRVAQAIARVAALAAHSGPPPEPYHRGDFSMLDLVNLRALVCAGEIGQALQWSRPVFSGGELSFPPQYANAWALSRSLFQVQPSVTLPLCSLPAQPQVAQLSPSVVLWQASCSASRAHPGDLLHLTFTWQCTAPVTEPLRVVVGLYPTSPSLLPNTEHTLCNVYTWLMGGHLPLPATPSGRAYRQDIATLIPTNAPPGERSIFIGLFSPNQPRPALQPVGHIQVD